MATLLLTALGTAVGGPIGGAIGSLVGNRIDRAVIGGGHREGPRLRELEVTASSYGTPIPRHFGTVRSAGTIIWATDLVESSEESGGGKGRPSTTTYSYSASFAVALASRPIRRLGRVWADGSLLRGGAGDLKVGGELRVYLGHGDQEPDPLIASAVGAACPAFRGIAYCVFESLQLADFGNRIPALTFEIVADDGAPTLARLVEPAGEGVNAPGELPGLIGYCHEGGSLATVLAAMDELYPLACDAGGRELTILPLDAPPPEPPLLPEAAVDGEEGSFGGLAGRLRRRRADASRIPAELRYYDPARDYQPGLQRADWRTWTGKGRTIEFPGVLSAGTARQLVNSAAERMGTASERLFWRLGELDPSLRPGSIVRAPGHAGSWRIDGWEWRERGVELELSRLAGGPARETPADAGQALPAADLMATPTLLAAFELPWDGTASADRPQILAAASSTSAGWTGAALYAVRGGGLEFLGHSGTRRSVIGTLAVPLTPSPAMLFEPDAAIEIDLVSADFSLAGTDLDGIAEGANRALVGDEILQFGEAAPLGDGRWRLTGLLRGRGGTEAAALAGHAAGTSFVLLDARPVRIDAARLGSATGLAAIGLADTAPVTAQIANPGATRRPLTPVHPRIEANEAGDAVLRWTRRARGAWTWLEGVEVPLNEQAEAYLVGIGLPDAPVASWHLAETELRFPASEWNALAATHAGRPLWVRQIGSHALSDPLLLTIFP